MAQDVATEPIDAHTIRFETGGITYLPIPFADGSFPAATRPAPRQKSVGVAVVTAIVSWMKGCFR